MLQHRKTDDDPPGPDWVAISGPAGTVKEVKERKVKSREKREERVETEDIQHLGDLTDEVSATFTLRVTFCSSKMAEPAPSILTALVVVNISRLFTSP